MARVTYKGDDEAVYVGGTRFEREVPVEVEDEELVQELREGSDRLSEFEFEVESD